MINCPKCSDPMVLRSGKHGEFYYCRYHGTISKRLAGMLLRSPDHLSSDMHQCTSTPEDVLVHSVTRTGMSIIRNMDDLGQLAEWEVDNEDRANWDEDSWMNVQPY